MGIAEAWRFYNQSCKTRRWTTTTSQSRCYPPSLASQHTNGRFISFCLETGQKLAMASATHHCYTLTFSLRRTPNDLPHYRLPSNVGVPLSAPIHVRVHLLRRSREQRASIACSAANKPSSSSEISSTAKIRSEVLSPFRSVRMFFYIAFTASGSLGGLIAITQLIGALANPSRAPEVPDIAKGLGIDLGAVLIFSFLYYRENKEKSAQLARLSREESLSNLKLRIDENRIIPVSSFRGIARLVICAGPASFVTESFKRSKPFTENLLDRGVLVVPLVTDGNTPTLEYEESEDLNKDTNRRRRLWQLAPVYMSEWSKWLDEQKKLAGVSPESPVYLSLRLDGRVRGSGVGYPPWNAFVAQLPPVKGLWSGLLDGMDGRVL